MLVILYITVHTCNYNTWIPVRITDAKLNGTNLNTCS